jgi:hypothetical protein
MHVAEPAARLERMPAGAGSFRSLLRELAMSMNGTFVLLALVVGVTWCALIGATLGISILRDGRPTAALAHHSSGNSYSIYELNWQVPTAFGSLTVSDARITQGALAEISLQAYSEDQPPVPPDKLQISLSLNMANNQPEAVASPPLDAFRLVSTYGSEADRVSGLSSLPGTLQPNASSTGTLVFAAPQDGSVLWLEYRERPDDRPVRIALGWARELPISDTQTFSVSPVAVDAAGS